MPSPQITDKESNRPRDPTHRFHYLSTPSEFQLRRFPEPLRPGLSAVAGGPGIVKLTSPVHQVISQNPLFRINYCTVGTTP